MKIHVEMTSEEFLEFTQWQKDKAKYDNKIEQVRRKGDAFSNKVLNAIEPDPKKEGKYKIVDQEHAGDLYEMALDW